MSTEDKFETLWKDFNSLTSALQEDIDTISSQIATKDSQTWRRLYVKSIASALETQSSFLKNHIKITGEVDDLGLSAEEEMLLHGRSKRPPFIKDLIFSIEIFSSVNYSFREVDKSTNDYEQLVTLVNIRNRITHPKKYSDIKITDIEIRKCQAGFNGFQELLKRVMDESAKSLLAAANGMRKFIDNNNSIK